MRQTLTLAAGAALCAFALTCKKEPPVVPPPPPPPDGQTIHITVEDVSCTEAWLKVSLTDLNEPRTITITQDGQTKLSSRIAGADSIFLLENLLPNRNYRFAAQRIRDTTITDTSGTVVATTLDTTSHNFTWQIDTLGDGNASTLNDIAIINDTLAYAVGELYLRDSTGQIDPRRYNLAIWTGTWQVRRITYQGIPPAIRFVFALAHNDVWLDPYFHWNGQMFQEIPISPIFIGVGVNKMWGGSSYQLHAVGDGGFIAHQSGAGTWQRLESGTILPINDIWGVRNATSGATEIYAVASMIDQNQGRKVLKVSGVSVEVIPDDGLPWSLRGIWFVPRGPYYVVGDGVYHKRDIGHSTPWKLYPRGEVTNYYTLAIRGAGRNDVVTAGAFGEIAHFNGVTWRNFINQTGISGIYYSVSIKGDLIIAVGYANNRGVVAIGRRTS